MRSSIVSLAFLLVVPVHAAADPTITVVHETGPAYVVQNEGRYGADGTPFDAERVGQQRNLVRVERTSVELSQGRHRVIALYAPLTIATRVRLAEALTFRDVTFAPGTVLDHTYRFDGFRGSYLYRVLDGCLDLELGASLQIRNADVAFTSADGTQYSNQDDIGFVPALKVRATYQPEKAWAMLEADGLSTFGLAGDTTGGLYDVAVAVGYPVYRRLDVYASLRLLGGGAKVPDQDFRNWANFASAQIGARVTFGH